VVLGLHHPLWLRLRAEKDWGLMFRLRIAFGVVLLFALSVSPAFADSVVVQYTITGTFGSVVPSAPLSGPDGSYTIAFSLPQQPTPDYFDTTAGDFAVYNVPIAYSYQCAGCSSPTLFSGPDGIVDFADATLGGMLAVDFIAGGNDYFWQFAGDQIFSGSVHQPTLEAYGPVWLADCGSFELDAGDFVNLGSATVAAQVVSTPEPSTLALLLAATAVLATIFIGRVIRS